VQYVTAPVAQQTLEQRVTASGTVNPQNNISVGTQVSGTIASISVDYNSKVKRGQVLARLDPSTFDAQLDQARAALAQAQAQAAAAQANAGGAVSGVSVSSANSAAEHAAVSAAQANIAKVAAALTLAQKTLARDSALLSQGYVAATLVDTDRANAAQTAADVAAAQAALAQAQAQAQAGAATADQSGSTALAQAAAAQAAEAGIESAQAMVRQDELNLAHSVITSPVDGTVVAREVSVGQTVAASLQTPTLFAIAQDLGKMQVDINVGEPDIGNVKAGNAVDFSVLAYPNRTFRGTVAEVRINPQTLNNVVTYDVVVRVENRDGALLPGMTANASIAVATAKNALVVPLAALQWNPRVNRAAAGAGGPTAQSPWGAVQGGAKTTEAIASGSTGSIFVERDGALTRVPVKIGLATTTQAAVVAVAPAQLAAGDRVVTAADGAAPHASRNARSARSGIGGAPMGGSPIRGIH
jgi:HlyD family secretion protein